MSKKAKRRIKKRANKLAKKSLRRAKRKAKKGKKNMSDAARLYRLVKQEIKRMLPDMLPTNRRTLAMMVTGILRSGDGRLSKIAGKVCYHYKVKSLVERFRRLVRNKNIDVSIEYGPFAEQIFDALRKQEEIILLIDTTKLGRETICLMVSAYYCGRALPIGWLVYEGKKGHSSQACQLELFKQIKEQLPETASVVLLGDGEFDGGEVVKWFEAQPNWSYVCRTSKSNTIFYQNQWIALKELKLKDGEEKFLAGISFTQAHKIPKINIMVVWHKGKKEHWFFVTDVKTFTQAKQWYAKRFTIETLFSDFKGRGYNLHKTGLTNPERVSRLIFAAALAYFFTVVLGITAIISGDVEKLVRTDAVYHSLFRLGLIYLDYLLNLDKKLPSLLNLSLPELFDPKSHHL